MGERNGAYRVIVQKPEGNRPFGRHRLRWKGNIKVDLQQMRSGGGGGMDWIALAKDRDRCQTFANAIIHLRVA